VHPLHLCWFRNIIHKEMNMAMKTKTSKSSQAEVPAGFGFGGIIDGITKLMEAAGKLKESGQFSQGGEFEVPGLGEKGKGIFGFSIKTMGGGDNPGVSVRPFGNIHKTKAGVTVEEDREPVVDVLEEGNVIRVIAELPGVSEADIACEVNGDILTISTKGPRSYRAEVLLGGAVKADSLKSSYNNGVLEVRLVKA